MKAGTVVDGHLGDARSREAQQGGKEAVHAGEDGQVLEKGSAEGLERAAGVDDRLVGDPVAHAVGDARRDPAHPVVLPPLPHAADDVEAVDLGEEPRDVRRVVLQVGVQGDDDLAAGVAEAGVHRRRLAAVPALVEHAHAVVVPGQPPQDFRAGVGAAVIDEEDLIGAPEAGHCLADLFGQDGQVLFLVEDGDDE